MPTQSLQDMFVVGVPIAEKIVRPILVYLFLVIALRVAGRRELAQINSADLVVLLILSNTVQNAIIGNDVSVTGGILGAIVLFALNWAVVRFLFTHPGITRTLEGEPTPLVKDGKLMSENLRREQISVAQLIATMHRQGFSGLEDVKDAYLEVTGTITIIGRPTTTDDAQHLEIMRRLARIEELLAVKN